MDECDAHTGGAIQTLGLSSSLTASLGCDYLVFVFLVDLDNETIDPFGAGSSGAQ